MAVVIDLTQPQGATIHNPISISSSDSSSDSEDDDTVDFEVVSDTSSVENPCAICFEELSEDAIESLACGHTFHVHCIEQNRSYNRWLCPLCNT